MIAAIVFCHISGFLNFGEASIEKPVKLFGGDRIIMIMIRQIILNPNFVESQLLQLKFHEKP